MTPGFEGLLFGAVGGSVVALVLRVVETHWLGPIFAESREAHTVLLRYSRPLAMSCDDAEYRIDRILKQADRREPIAFACSPNDAKSPDWFTRESEFWIMQFNDVVDRLPVQDICNAIQRAHIGAASSYQRGLELCRSCTPEFPSRLPLTCDERKPPSKRCLFPPFQIGNVKRR